jgi:methylated-DNA-protein-cysteine methyltransferase-like protein
VPWHRVVNAAGGCSTDRVAGNRPGRQQGLLESEGIDFSGVGRLDMNSYRVELDIDDVVELLVEAEATP